MGPGGWRRVRLIGFSGGGAEVEVEAATAGQRREAFCRGRSKLPCAKQWLVKRHAMLLDMMRRNHVDMWIVVNEEFHNDPLTEYVAPPRVYTGGRDIFVFVDAGAAGLKKFAITGYSEENLQRFFESADDPSKHPVDKQLRELWDTYHPAHIALGIDGRRGVTRSLTKSSYDYLADKMGPEAAKNFVPAQDLIDEYLSTRIPEEFDTYNQEVILTDHDYKARAIERSDYAGQDNRGRRAALALR